MKKFFIAAAALLAIGATSCKKCKTCTAYNIFSNNYDGPTDKYCDYELDAVEESRVKVNGNYIDNYRCDD